jgi:hypothetical protein
MVQIRTIKGSLSRLTRIRQPNRAKVTANLLTNNNSQSSHAFTWLASVITCPPQAARTDFAHLRLRSQSRDFIGQRARSTSSTLSNEISAPTRRTLPAGPAELLFALSQLTSSPNTCQSVASIRAASSTAKAQRPPWFGTFTFQSSAVPSRLLGRC